MAPGPQTTAAYAAFEAAMAAAMAQLATFDATAIDQGHQDLSQWLRQTPVAALSPTQWGEVQRRLTEYRNTCRFLQGTLNRALCEAGRIEGAGYGGRGRPVERVVPLMRRYG
jgi:hypothetical protein